MLDYQELSDLFHEARAGSPELLGRITLPQFAEELNRVSGTNDYSAGLHDNWIKRASAGINRTLEWTGLPEKSGQAFQSLAESIGISPETGYNVGHGLPRAAVNFAPLALAAAAAPITGGGSLAAALPLLGLGATAGLSGAESYTESGSPAQGLITAGTTLALPAFSKIGGQLALKAIGTPITEGIDAATGQFIKARLEKTLGQRLASYAGGQAGAFTDFEIAHQASSIASGEGLQNPIDPENVFATVAGQLPFMVADIPRVARSSPAVEIIDRMTQTSAKVADAKAGLASIPDVVSQGEAATNPDLVKFNDILANKVKVSQDDTLSPEQKAQRLAELDTQETAVVSNQAKQSAEQKADSLFDEPIKPKPVSPEPRSPLEAESTTGLRELGGGGVVSSMYDMMFKKLQGGDLTEGGGPSNALKRANPEFQAGRITTSEELSDFFNKRGKFAVEPVGVEAAIAEIQRRNAPGIAQHIIPIAESARENIIAPVVDLPTAVDKVKKANETRVELGETSVTNADLESKADALISNGSDLTPAVEAVTQAVAHESADRADVVQRVTQRTLKKQQGQAEAMAYMAEHEHILSDKGVKQPNPNFPRDVIEGWLQRAASLSGGQVDRYTNDVAAVYQNWDTEGRPGGPQGLNARLSVALQNAGKPLPLETRTLKNDGSVSSVKGGRGNQSRKTFDTTAEALDASNAEEARYLEAIPEKMRGKDTSVFTVRKVKGQEKYYVEQRIYPRAEALYEGHTPEVDRNVLTQAEQDDHNTHAEVTDAAPQLVAESKGQDVLPEHKQAAEVVKTSVADFAAALRFAPDTTLEEIIGFGTKENPTTAAHVETFRTRISTIIELVGKGNNDPEYLNDRLREVGVSFDTPEQVTEFMDSPNFITALGVARDLVHDQKHPTISLDAIQMKSLLPIIGNKDMALKVPEVNDVLTKFSNVVTRVKDAFSGSGRLAEAAKDMGAKEVVLNVRDPRYFQVFHEIKTDPQAFGRRVAAVVEPISATRDAIPTMRDGSDIKAYLNHLEETDPTVGLFVKQQFSPRGREVKPGSAQLGINVTDTGLRELPKRIQDFAGKIDNLTSEDGWNTLAQAKAGEGVMLDPPYVSARGGAFYTGGKSGSTVDSRLAEYQKYVIPAQDRGVNMVIFDQSDPRLIKYLRDNGFRVSEFTRPQSTRPEFIATNTSEVAKQPLQPKPFGLIGGLSNLFDKWYKQMGLTDTTLEGYTQSSLRVAGLFKQLDDARVGELINDAKDKAVYGGSVDSSKRGFPGAIYLAQLPKDFGGPEQARIAHKFILGHELWHSLENQHKLGQLSPDDTRVMNRLVDHLETSDINHRTQVLTEFFNEILPKWAQTDELRNTMLSGADSASETRANLGGMLATSLTEFKPRTVRSLIEFLPKPIGDFITTAIRHMKNIVSSISGANIFNERGMIEPVTNEFTHPVLNEFTTGFLALTRQIGHVDELTQQFMQLQNFEPVGFRQLQKDYQLNPIRTSMMKGIEDGHTADIGGQLAYLMGVDKAPKGFEDDLQDKKSFFGGLMQTFSKLVNPALQFAEANPIIRPAVWLPMEYLKQGHDFTRRSLTPFSGRWNPATGDIEFGAGMNHLRRLQTDTTSRAALNDIQLWQNDNGKPFVKPDGRTFEEPALVANLSPRQLQDVISTNLAIRASNEINQQAYLNAKRATLVQRVAQTVSGQNPSWKPADAKLVAENMLAATEALGDPTKVAQAQETFRQLQGKVSPEQFIQLQQFATEGLQALGKLKDFYTQHPEFTSERRYGGYAISYLKQDGKTGRVSGRSEKDVNEKLGQITGVQRVLERVTPETVQRTEGLSQSFIETAQKYEDVIKSRMQQILGDAEFDKIKDLSFTDPLVRELAARQLGERQPYRRGASGRETLDMLENHLHYTNALTRSMGTHYIQNELALLLRDPNLASRQDLKTYARQHVANFLAPDSAAGRALTATNFLYYMGMNVSTTMMESVQSFFSLVPTLIREGGGILDSYRNVMGTARKIGQWAVSKSWDNPEHAQLMERAGREHNIQLGSFSEFLDPEEHGAVNISRLMLRKEPATMSDLVTKPVGQFSQLARSYYSIFTNFNHRIALISAFDHFRGQGMGFEEAYDNANRVNHVVNFSGGRAARPVGWFQPSDPIGRTAAQGLYSLMSYQFGMISMMGRYLREGFGPVREGVSPWQRTQARQAAVVMLGTQLASAGALGMPAVGASIAVLEQIFPELQLNKKIRESIASLGGDDQELGAILSDMSLHGVANQIGGVDLGSRFALGNILGTSNYDGFSVENFLGPTGSLLKNMAMGVQSASQGDLGRAAQSVMPQGFKRLIDLYRNDWTAKDQRGNLLLQPTLGEKFAMMIGFSPTRVTALRDAQRIMQRSQQIERNDTIRFHQDLADRVLQGDYQGARQGLLDKTKTDSTYDPRVGARAIADVIANKTLPVDLRRMGARSSVQDDAEILRTYSLTGPPPSELQRLQIKQDVMRRLGLGSSVAPSEVQAANLSDQLQSSDPTLMRSAVRSRVSRLLHPSRGDTLPQLLVSPASE